VGTIIRRGTLYTLKRGADRIDSDGDGVPDYYEIYMGTNPSDGESGNTILTMMTTPGILEETSILEQDSDGDGLNNEDELAYGTDPFSEDTDDDGISDYDEVFLYMTDPINCDSDGDGLYDGTEVENGFDPNNKDTDNNGIEDGKEEFGRIVRMPSSPKSDSEMYPVVWAEGIGECYGKYDAVSLSGNTTLTGIGSITGMPYEFAGNSSMNTVQFGFCIPKKAVSTAYSKEDYVIAGYDYLTNQLKFAETDTKLLDDGSMLILTNQTEAGTYMLINYKRYRNDVSVSEYGSVIEAGKADVVFVIDTTGSMNWPITNVIENIDAFSDYLSNLGVDIRVGLVEYKDIYEDGMDSTKDYGFFYDLEEFKNAIHGFYINGGGDNPETAVDALNVMCKTEFRAGVNKFAILVTDASYKNGIQGDSTYTMQQMIENLAEQNICTTVVANSSYFKEYETLVERTNGELCNISDSNFAQSLQTLMNKMGTMSHEGIWVRLTNGSIVCLKEDPHENNSVTDTDEDGIPDLNELGDIITVTYNDIYTGNPISFEAYSFKTNPVLADSDGDGYADDVDTNPIHSDVVAFKLQDSRGYIRVQREDGAAYGVYKDINGETDTLSTGVVALENMLLYLQKYKYTGLTYANVNGENCSIDDVQTLTKHLANSYELESEYKIAELFENSSKLKKVMQKVQKKIGNDKDVYISSQDMGRILASYISAYDKSICVYDMPFDIFSKDEILEQICASLDENIPIMLQLGIQGKTKLYDTESMENVSVTPGGSEWVTVIGYKKDSLTNTTVLTVLYDGNMYYMNYNQMIKDNSFMGCIAGIK
jgi:hypothetical protein